MAIELLLKRRSIRKYSGESVAPDELTKILKAGMAAPSAKNRQPWHFVVIQEKETLMKLSEAHPHGKMLAEAAAAVAVCGDMNVAPDYWIQDCSAATENILIAVSALGLGAVWLGCHPRPERVTAIKGILEIPEYIGVLSLISIGHPGEEKEPRTQYDEERVHKEKW